MLSYGVSPAFTLALENKIEALTKEALSLSVSDTQTHVLKVRIQTLKDVIKFVQGETKHL